MGNSNSNVETSSIDKINDIDEEQLDLSNIDKLQLKAIKQMSERLEKLETMKCDKLLSFHCAKTPARKSEAHVQKQNRVKTQVMFILSTTRTQVCKGAK